jgi:hypothetical protein
MSSFSIDAPASYGGTQTPGDYLRLISQTPGLDALTVATLQGAAAGMDNGVPPIEVEATQSGSGITPIIGVNINLLDRVNIGAKYEHHTKIELENETVADSTGMFRDGAISRADLPGMFALGVEVAPIEKLKVSVGLNYFLDQSAYYGNFATDENGLPIMEDDGISFQQIDNETTIDDNAYTISGSLEYRFLGILGASVGFSTGNLGVNDTYQSDLSFGLKSTSIGGGVFVHLGDRLILNAGYVHVMYDDYEKVVSDPRSVPYTNTYGKKTSIFSVGLDISL